MPTAKAIELEHRFRANGNIFFNPVHFTTILVLVGYLHRLLACLLPTTFWTRPPRERSAATTIIFG